MSGRSYIPDTEPGLESWLKLNAEYASIWPNITIKREPPADAKEFDGVANKLEQYFSPNPGQGDATNEQGDDRGQPKSPPVDRRASRAMGKTHKVMEQVQLCKAEDK